jgi:hypothetical protein
VKDAVGAADRLRAEVSATLAAALGDTGSPSGRIHVGWWAALAAAACPAAYRAEGEHGWGFPGWSPATAAGAVARATLDRHLEEAPPGASLDPLEAVRSWIRTARDTSADGAAGWVAERRDEGDAAALAATAAAASRWLAGFVRVLGWPLPPDLALLNVARDGPAPTTPTWRPPDVPAVSVAAGADARLGRVSGAGRFALVVHRPTGGDDGAVRLRASVEAATGALTRGIAPEVVMVTTGDTGERLRLDVDAAVLHEGGRLLVEAVRQRSAAAERGFDPVDATPSGRCRRCEHAEACPAGQAWLAGPGRWRDGLPALGPVLQVMAHASPTR